MENYVVKVIELKKLNDIKTMVDQLFYIGIELIESNTLECP